MDGPPEVGCLIYKWRNGHPEYSNRRREFVRTWTTVSSDEKGGNESEFKQQRDGEFGVPRPIHAPTLPRPQRTRHQSAQAEQHRQLRARQCKTVHLRRTPKQKDHTTNTADKNSCAHRHPTRHVKVENLLDETHRVLIGRACDHTERQREHERRGRRKRREQLPTQHPSVCGHWRILHPKGPAAVPDSTAQFGTSAREAAALDS